VRYSSERWSLGARAHYFGSSYFTPTHEFNPVTGGATVPEQVYFDLFGSLRLLKNTELSAGARNVFNTRPPFDGTFYSQYGDPRRGTWYLSLSQKF